jgi:hypothetical protein
MKSRHPTLVTLFALALFPVAPQSLAKPSREIRFEEELVEGLNRRPLDSFHQLSEELGGHRPRLYRKRSGFQDRNEILFQEMRMKP